MKWGRLALGLLLLCGIAMADTVRFRIEFRDGPREVLQETRSTTVRLTPMAGGERYLVELREFRRDLAFLYGLRIEISRAEWASYLALRRQIIPAALGRRGTHGLRVQVPAGSYTVVAELTSDVPYITIRPPRRGSEVARTKVELYAWLPESVHPAYPDDLGLFAAVSDIEVLGPSCPAFVTGT